MNELVTFTHLGLILLVFGALMSLWLHRRLGRMHGELANRLQVQDERLADALKGVQAALDDVRHVQMGVERVHAGMQELRRELAQARFVHPPDQHPDTLAALREIGRQMALVDQKMDAMAHDFRGAVLGASLRFVRPGSA